MISDQEISRLLKVPVTRVFNKTYVIDRLLNTSCSTFASANKGKDWIMDSGYKPGDRVEIWFLRETGIISDIDWRTHDLRIDVNGKCIFDVNRHKPNHVNYDAIKKVSKIRKNMKAKLITYPTELPNFFTVMSKV